MDSSGVAGVRCADSSAADTMVGWCGRGARWEKPCHEQTGLRRAAHSVAARASAARRTTLIVESIDEALRLYRDVLGLEVFYDQRISRPSPSNPSEYERSVRLVLLKSSDSYIGVLGLLQYMIPTQTTVDLQEYRENSCASNCHYTEKRPPPGAQVQLFNVKDLPSVLARVQATTKARIAFGPVPREYPSYDGSEPLRTLSSGVIDPDGNFLEITELLFSTDRIGGKPADGGARQ